MALGIYSITAQGKSAYRTRAQTLDPRFLTVFDLIGERAVEEELLEKLTALSIPLQVLETMKSEKLVEFTISDYLDTNYLNPPVRFDSIQLFDDLSFDALTTQRAQLTQNTVRGIEDRLMGFTEQEARRSSVNSLTGHTQTGNSQQNTGNHLHTAPNLEEFTANARAMLRQLPGKIPLVNTMREHPRVINQLGDYWRSPTEFGNYLDQLLMTERSDRQGFSFHVVCELANLKDFYLAWVAPQQTERAFSVNTVKR